MGRAFEVRKASIMKTGAAKAKLYSRFGKEIYMAAKSNPDPDSNLNLKHLIDKAKGKQVPTDIVKRAIDKAKGGKGEDFSSVRYEGFGPSGATILIDCLTDNVNRTVSDVKNCFTKSKNKIGVKGSVSHFYSHTALLAFPQKDEEEILEALIMADCDFSEMEEEEGESIIYGDATDLYKIKEALEEAFGEIVFSTLEQTMLPSEYIKLENEEDIASWDKLNSMLDELDDVQNIYHNVEL